jgi:hypothetical protein
MEERKIMLKETVNEIIKWVKEFANECCSESVETAGTICDETRKQNAQFVKAIMDSLR